MTFFHCFSLFAFFMGVLEDLSYDWDMFYIVLTEVRAWIADLSNWENGNIAQSSTEGGSVSRKRNRTWLVVLDRINHKISLKSLY